jgi:uncharacterized protein YdbL (DUF1318 family)
MKARQKRLEGFLAGSDPCLGERLNGLLKINYDCTEEARKLAEEENKARRALHELMGRDLGMTPEAVGEERARRNIDRYRPGVLREVRISATETTWWDGRPPDPRKTALSRILSLQYAKAHQGPDAGSPVVRDNIQQYEAFGVVDSTEGAAGTVWYQVTEAYVPKVKPDNWSPDILGWVSEEECLPWRRALVMRFTNLYQRKPSLFFRDPAAALTVMRLPPDRRVQRIQTIRSEFGDGSGRNGVVAMEPAVGAKQERMVMYPVLDYYGRETGETVEIDGMASRLLEVAARTRAGESSASTARHKDIPIDILFVMDTTHSMKPYLASVLTAVETFVGSGVDDGVRFGFIGYQDKNPAFSYRVREFTNQTLAPVAFLRILSGVSARSAPVRGDDIPESVFEGLNSALESDQWRENSVKVIFLVGDAPGREEELAVRTIRDKAFTRQIRIFAFHIENSKVSSAYDRQSQQQYRDLSAVYEGSYGEGGQTPYLLSVDAGADRFGDLVLDRFQEAYKAFGEIQATARAGKTTLPAAEKGSLTELIFQQATLLLPDESIPAQEVTGWVPDKVLTEPGRQALAPMILLSEAELDELEQRVRELKAIGEQALRGEGGTTLDFFDLVERNTRFTMVDPEAVNFRDAFAVPLGIDQLPYESDIMAATRAEFHNPDRVQDFVRKMNLKLRHYEDLRRKRGDPDVWKKLSRGATDRDRVVGVELNQLP